MNSIVQTFSKTTDFSGRAGRREYWLFTLFYCLVSVGLLALEYANDLLVDDLGIGPVSAVFVLITLLPNVSVGVRRLHDTGRTGWWYGLIVLPYVGPLVLLVMVLQHGELTDNEYGPPPQGAASTRQAESTENLPSTTGEPS